MVSYTDLDNLFNSDEDELTVSDVQKVLASASQKPARNNSCLFVVWGLIFFFLAFAGEVAKHAHKQELWPLSGKRTVLVDLCRQIFDANNLLILLPYDPHSMYCLNIPSVRVVQIQQVLVCSFPVVWALFNWFI